MLRQPLQQEHRIARRTSLMIAAIMIICASSLSVMAQWTTDGSGNINFTGGKVGVATTTPSTALEVGRNASGTPTGVMITGGSTVAAPVLYFNYADAGANLKRWLLFGDINGAFNLGTQPDAGGAANSKLFISNAGNIGMGTTAPTAASGYTALSLNNSTGTLVDFMTSNVLKARLQSDGTTFYFNNLANGPIQIYTNSAERMRIAADGSVGIGTITPSEKLEIAGNLKLTGTGNITATGTIDAGNIKARYQDVAEWVESSQELNAGTVVILDSNNSNQVIASTSAYDSRVAGVISLQPGIALGEHAEGRVLVATTGRVKVKVDASNGPINIGDLLVTSDKTGVAMKSLPVEIGGVRIHRPGTLIGKALQPLAAGTGEILVLLSLQ